MLSLAPGVMVVVVCAQPPAPALPARLDETDPMIREAVRAVRAEVERSPGSGAAWHELGAVLHANGYLAEARVCYERALGLMRGGDADVRYLLGLVEWELGNVEAARARLEEVAELAREDPDPRWRLGLLHLELGELERAEGMFRAALRVAPGREEAVVGLARVALLRRGAAEAASLLEGARFGAALAPHARGLLARAYRRLGRIEEAAALDASAGPPVWTDSRLSRVFARRTGYDAEMDRAREEIERGEGEAALARLALLRERLPDRSQIITMEGYALDSLGRREEAIARWRRALEVDQEDARAHLNLGTVLAEEALARGEGVEEAMAHIERAIELNDGLARAHRTKGALLGALGRRGESIAPLERALELSPGEVGVLHQLGQAYLALGRWEEGVRVLRRYALVKPRSAHAHLSLALACVESGRLEEAERALRRGGELLGEEHPQVRALREMLEAAKR